MNTSKEFFRQALIDALNAPISPERMRKIREEARQIVERADKKTRKIMCSYEKQFARQR